MGNKPGKAQKLQEVLGPEMDQNGTINQALANVSDVNAFDVVQKFSLVEAVTGGIWEKANIYYVSNKANDQRIFEVREKSAKCDRICCAPYHSFTLSFHPYIDGKRIQGPPSHTIERQGCGYTCCPPHCCEKCFGCCACSDICLQKYVLHKGNIEATEQMKVGFFPKDNVIGTIEMPKWGGVFTPTLELKDASGKIEGRVEGPFCWGGCSELCCKFTYPVSSASAEKKAGDVAIITKEKPKSATGALKEMVGDSDIFSMEVKNADLLPSSASMGNEGEKTITMPEKKIKLLASLLAIDFMLFEFDQNMCGVTEEGKPYCTLFLCYCCGCIINNKCVLSSGEGE
eukprot:c1102_g1_i1.p1 GENE.c1102_g1_i1~~c1102_g1_i1.p1  ORF type:complete len:343 (+),score=23.02 c1102_g1_i1:51-1079(+)